MPAKTVGYIWIKNVVTEHRKAMRHSDRAVLGGSRMWEEASDVIEEFNTVVVGSKEEIVSFKREIKMISLGKNRNLMDWEDAQNYSQKKRQVRCRFHLFWVY